MGRIDLLDDVLADPLERHVGAMLRGDDHRLHRHRLAVGIAHRHLALAVRTEIVQLAAPAHLGEPLHEPVRQHDGQGHQLRGLGARVAEHEALVAGAEVVHAHGDVAGLLVDGGDDAARLEVEAELRARVADLADGLAGDLGDVDVAGRGDLPRHHDEPGGEQGFAGHPARGVLGEDRVQHRVRDLVGDLVGMAFRHRLGREQVLLTRHHAPPYISLPRVSTHSRAATVAPHGSNSIVLTAR